MTAGVEYDPTTSDQFFAAWGRRAFRAGFDYGDSE